MKKQEGDIDQHLKNRKPETATQIKNRAKDIKFINSNHKNNLVSEKDLFDKR